MRESQSPGTQPFSRILSVAGGHSLTNVHGARLVNTMVHARHIRATQAAWVGIRARIL